MKLSIDTLFKLNKVGGKDIVDALGSLEQISNKASEMAQNASAMAKGFGDIVGQTKIIFNKIQDISKRLEKEKE
jgi:hypothetical protein